jgi:tRNA pseudouridine38-40 synthase
MRYFLDISYLGTDFHGWQIQNNAHSVQAELNQALSTILRSDISCLGSGRTDTGVHARQQIVHFDVPEPIDEEQLTFKLNSLLPKSVAVQSCKRVKDEAHARFDAEMRAYEYHIHCAKNPFKEGLSYYYNLALDERLMTEACSIIRQWRNFQAFSKVQTEVNHFECEITEIHWEPTNQGYIFHVSANRFLRGMVRAIVGTLLEVNRGKMSIDQLKAALESGDRRKAGRAVPAEGLYLTRVVYPESIYL